jgi:hypothetical protein
MFLAEFGTDAFFSTSSLATTFVPIRSRPRPSSKTPFFRKVSCRCGSCASSSWA